MQITINTDTCTRCSRCAKVCPSLTLTQDRAGEPITVNDVASCIVCGHCVAACPTDSITHSEFPEKCVHEVDYDLYPTPEQMMMLVKSRRSNRAFSNQPIAQVSLDMIAEAAHRAPTASNQQNVAFTIINDAATLRKISEFVLETFGSIVRKVNNPFVRPIIKMVAPSVMKYIPAFIRMQREFQAGNDMVLRGATALILIHTPTSSRFGSQDANLAYQNGSLMAETLGISQFYTGFVLSAIQQRKGKLEQLLGIEGCITAGLALGMPAFRYGKYIDRKPIDVNEKSI